MKITLLILRILETILQVMIIPCCIIGDWADKYYGSCGIEFQNLGFLDAAEIFDKSYLATILVISFAVLIIIMIWTKAKRFAFIPALLQVIILIKTITDFVELSSHDKGHIKDFGYCHSGMIITAFVICILISMVSKKKS